MRRQRRHAPLVVCCLVTLALLSACRTPPPAPPPPPTTGSATNASGATFNASVTPGPPAWTYAITGTGIAAVQLHSTGNISGCTLTVNAKTPPSETVTQTNPRPAPTDIEITAPTGTTTGWAAITFTVRCDKRNGPCHLLITEVGSNRKLVIGPIAGPE